MLIHFQDPRWLWLLLMIPVLIGVWIYADRRRRQALRVLVGDRMRAGLYSVYRGRHVMSLMTTLLALLFLICALSRPGWNPKETVLSQSGRDVVFLLDVSQSMLAQDRSPSRLENAKLAIADCVDGFRSERVGLVVFAGSSSIQCPLTRDYEFFRYALETAGPESVDHGGTLIGEALSKVCEKLFSDSMRGFQDLILITDGGDHGPDMITGIDQLNALDVHVIVVGVGSDTESTRIPLPADKDGRISFLQYQGLDVMTMQDRKGLEGLSAAAENGVYLNAGTRPLALGPFYSRYSEHAKTIEFKGEVVERYEEGFQPFIFAALVLLLFLGPVSDGLLRLCARPTHIALLIAMFHVSAQAGTPEELRSDRDDQRLRLRGTAVECHTRGSLAVDEGDFEEAREWYRLALSRTTHPESVAQLLYNIATTRVLAVTGDSSSEDRKPDLQQLRRAQVEYRDVLDLAPEHREAAENLELVRREVKILVKAEADSSSAESDTSESSDSRKSGESDGTGDDEGDPGDESVDPLEPQEGTSEAGSRSTGRVDMNDRVIPPPNLSPQDLLNAEAEINRMRQQRRRGRSGTVEKDW